MVGRRPTSKESDDRYPLPLGFPRMISTVFTSRRLSTSRYVWFCALESCKRVRVTSVGTKKSIFPSRLTSAMVMEAPK